MGFLRALPLRLRSLLRRDAAEREIDDELRFHLDMQTEEYIGAGMSPKEARRQALIRFGGVEGHKEEVRRAQGVDLMGARITWLDIKLGFRMLVKYPGLTLTGGLAMAFAICVAIGGFEFLNQVVNPKLPLPDGDRIVDIRNRDVMTGSIRYEALHDFVTWRDELTSVEEVGAYRSVTRNLSARGSAAEPVVTAEISAAGFRVAKVSPLLGRSLVDADEVAGAPPVFVLGHDTWERRFASDPEVVGSDVRLNGVVHTVVGVMPEGFGFPVAHDLWVPLRLNPLDHEPGGGPRILVFGRLAPGATLEEARAELTALGQRIAVDQPETHEQLRPEVAPLPKAVIGLPVAFALVLASFNLFLGMLLVIVCGNVALLMFARAAARESELVVRSALGARRGSIILQLFAEALVLSSAATLVGIAAAHFTIRWMFDAFAYGTPMSDSGSLPFWFHASLSPESLFYAGLLTVLAAGIAGVVPALKVTRGLAGRLRGATSGGGGFRFGGVWTTVVVAQVALTLAFPVFAFGVWAEIVDIRSTDVGFPPEEYLVVRLELDRETDVGIPADPSPAEFAARFGATYRGLEERLEREPEVRAVTFAERLPLMYHPHRRIELDSGPVRPVDPEFGYRRVSSSSVALDFFEVLDAPIITGRGFTAGDLNGNVRVAIVNQSFVDHHFGGLNPIGRRFRYLYFEELPGPRSEDEPWYEVIGVVRDMGMAVGAQDPKVAGIYHPMGPATETATVRMAVHLRSDPASFVPRLRAIADEQNPGIRLHDVMPMDELRASELRLLAFSFYVVVAVSVVALILSLAGIYAVFSFTAAQRTKEIGIRVALGANPRRVVMAIFRKPLFQVGMGIVAGGGIAAILAYLLEGELSGSGAMLLVLHGVFMAAICLLASVVPTRRALAIEPTVALKSDG